MTGGYLLNRLWIKKVSSCYSASQVALYLERIGFPSRVSEQDIIDGNFKPSFQALERIMRGHLLHVPWENTAMHYSKDHTMDVSPQGVYDRFINDAKGSYCFGQNTLLLGVLRCLGFRAYSGAARVNLQHNDPAKTPYYRSLTHMLLFVQPNQDSNETWMVDVGFGALNLVRPIPLLDHQESGVEVKGAFSGEVHRLMRGEHPNCSLDLASSDGSDPHIATHKKWNLEVRNVRDGEQADDVQWKRLYSFTEEEFQLSDYEDASFVVAHKPGPSIFRQSVLAVRHLVDDEDSSADTSKFTTSQSRDLYRLTLFGNHVKKHSKKGTEVVRTITSEQDKVTVLKEFFGVVIKPEDVAHIEGRESAFRS
ncbi:arylamine N-acetyltransferase 1 [Coprinopsis sp. MPI-PUGE-AT-0042]|nr:arylamine N-acetyltransferase 1 [Coprinopsis sp. MPI-PUGE-AT-0042]